MTTKHAEHSAHSHKGLTATGQKTIRDYAAAAAATEDARMKAATVVANDQAASQAADAEDQAAQAAYARALHKIGPWVDVQHAPPLEVWSDDGVTVQHKVVNVEDVVVPDDTPPS